jgi:uncharacterized protein (UPF0212 family)
MRMLADADLLALWDRCHGQAPGRRALALLAAAEPGADPAALPAGLRDAALLRLHARALGGRLEAVASCPVCGEQLEVALDAAELAAAGGPTPETELVVRAAGHEVRFRAPTAADLAALPRDGAELLARCVTTGRRLRDGAAVEAAALPEAVRAAVERAMAAADPAAELDLALSCPACGHGWSEALDPAEFVWVAIEARARWLAGEVHALAGAYGWSEAEILAQRPARRRLYLEVLGR